MQTLSQSQSQDSSYVIKCVHSAWIILVYVVSIFIWLAHKWSLCGMKDKDLLCAVLFHVLCHSFTLSSLIIFFVLISVRNFWIFSSKRLKVSLNQKSWFVAPLVSTLISFVYKISLDFPCFFKSTKFQEKICFCA